MILAGRMGQTCMKAVFIRVTMDTVHVMSKRHRIVVCAYSVMSASVLPLVVNGSSS